MAVTFTSQFRQLAHGALNWDTQLDADLANLEALFVDNTGGINWASGFTNGIDNTSSAYTVLTRIGWHANFTLHALTANAAAPGNNDTILLVPDGFRPQVHAPAVGWALTPSGTYIQIRVVLSKNDSALRIVDGSVPAGSKLSVPLAYKIA